MAAFGYGLEAALFEAASTLGTVGLSVGLTTPDTDPALLLVQALVMLLGRLEIFTVFIGLRRVLRDNSPRAEPVS